MNMHLYRPHVGLSEYACSYRSCAGFASDNVAQSSTTRRWGDCWWFPAMRPALHWLLIICLNLHKYFLKERITAIFFKL